jgi:hypothetical protein
MDVSDDSLTSLLVKALAEVRGSKEERERYPALAKVIELWETNPQRAVLMLDAELSCSKRETQDEALRQQAEVYSEDEMWDQRRVIGGVPSPASPPPSPPAPSLPALKFTGVSEEGASLPSGVGGSIAFAELHVQRLVAQLKRAKFSGVRQT